MKKNKQFVKQNSFTEFLLYTTPNGKVKMEIFLHDENIWLTQKKMAELFDCSTDNISLHLKKIYQENEVDRKSTTEEFSAVQKEGERQLI